MGEEMLVSKSTAVKQKGDANGGFGTGLNRKNASSFAPPGLLQDVKLSASPVGRNGGKSKQERRVKSQAEDVFPPVEKAEMSLAGKEEAALLDESNIVVGKHHPLLEGISSLINGYHRHKSVPPIPVQSVADIAQYLYLTWLVEKYPKDETAKIERDAYSPLYASALITLKGDFTSQGDAEKEFLLEARKKAMKAAIALIRLRQGLEAQLKIIDGEKAAKLAELEREKQACAKWVEDYYAGKKQFLSEWIAKKATPIEEYLKKFGLPAGGALVIASATFKSAVLDITEHIPFLTGVAPELIGLGIVGLWAVAWVGRKILEWHLSTARNRLPKHEERRKEKEMARIAAAKSDVEKESEANASKLKREFDDDRKAVIGELKGEYEAMLSSNGYAAAA